MTSRTTRRRYLTLSGSALAATLAGCSSGASTSEETATGGGDGFEQTTTVEMNDQLAFVPKRIEVSSGTTVTWKNVGSVAHSVTAYEDEIPEGATYFASGGFDSQAAAEDGYPDNGRIAAEGTYEHTFETTGEYKYYCIPHEMNGMVGYVRVI